MKAHMPVIAAFIVSVVLSAIRLGPVFFEPASHLPGAWGHPDNLSNQWLLVWLSEQVASGQSLLHNDQYYWPVGDYPWLAGNGSEGFLHLPVYLLFGWPQSIGLYVSCVWIVMGLAAYRLGRVCGAGEWGALFTIVAVLSLPYLGREYAAGRYSQMNLIWLLLSMSEFIGLLVKPSFGKAARCGICVALCGIFYWYYAWFFCLF